MIKKRIVRLLFLLLVLVSFSVAGVGIVFAEKKKDVGTVTGTVVETMNAAGYTYILVENNYAKQWVAIPESEVKVDEQVTYQRGMTMNNFYSKSLDRTFKAIIFSSGLVGKSSEKTGAMSENQGGENSFEAAVQQEKALLSQPQQTENSPGSMGAVVPLADIKVEKAEGENAYVINDIFEHAAELDGKTVRVRGKVVKINANIMGVNWLHLQDGSGNPMKNSHDLVVTTVEDLEEGRDITIEGVVVAEKDFGYGYKYAVLLEQGTAVGE